jgi:hypothetical protein
MGRDPRADRADDVLRAWVFSLVAVVIAFATFAFAMSN